MNFIGNTFSLNMIESAKQGIVSDFRVTKISQDGAQDKIGTGDYKSVLGNRDIANLVSDDLDMNIRFNRETVKLRDGDNMIVCQYSGPRVMPGQTILSPDAQIDYFLVEMDYQ